MRPCRRAGSSIDVKVSSFKKLITFLQHAEELGWLALKKSADPVVTRICRDHPDVREWKPWPKHVTAEAEEAIADEGAGRDSCPSAAVQIELVWKILKLKPMMEVLKMEMPADECWTREDCLHAVKLYADSQELWLKNNRKRIGLDALLMGVLHTQDADSSSFSIDSLADGLLRSLPACHRVTAPQGGAAGGVKRSTRPGKPPSVQVRTDTRRGHNVTLVHGLEAYGVNMEAFASSLQKVLASSAAVEEASPTQAACVMVQGFWDAAVVDWLGKVGVPTECILHQAKKGQQQKKAKQASNIVKH